MGELEGKAALVTGGTTGIGFAICQAFLREGAGVALTGRNEELGRKAERSLGADASFLDADAADPDQIRASVRDATTTLGGLEVLVNNAGVGVLATPLETPLRDYERVMDVNVRGYLLYAQECFPLLEARGGSMIHISSDAAISGEVEIAIYSVSKAAVNMLSNMLAIEGARRGVRSNVICPGIMGDGGPDARQPLDRTAVAADIANAALFLASDEASFITGQVLAVDGGHTTSYPEIF